MTEIPGFDEEAFAKEQRRLLKLATQRPKTPNDRTRPDEAAASKLLLYFSREMITDARVREAVMDGAREVAAYVVNETLLRQSGKPVTINPLMYFNGVDLDYRPTKKNKKAERLSMAAAFNDPDVPGSPRRGPLMSPQEARHALTTRWTVNDVKDGLLAGERKPRRDWPKTVKDVERKLVEYVQAKHGKVRHESCVSYVHASYPAIAWRDNPDQSVQYPESWIRLTPST